MITVPEFPAWVCDICGKCEYDTDALDNLAMMLYPPPVLKQKRKITRSKGKGDAPSPGIRQLTSK